MMNEFNINNLTEEEKMNYFLYDERLYALEELSNIDDSFFVQCQCKDINGVRSEIEDNIIETRGKIKDLLNK